MCDFIHAYTYNIIQYVYVCVCVCACAITYKPVVVT